MLEVDLTCIYSYLCSDEDTDVKAIVKSWMNSQSDNLKNSLSLLIEDYFYQALEWVLKQVSKRIINWWVCLVT